MADGKVTRYWMLLTFLVWLSGNAFAAEPNAIFSRQEVAAYQPKGPSRCFRQLCLEYNNVTRDENRLKNHELLFSEYDAVEYAQYCKDINLDAALMLAVPQGGYTAYLQTRVGEPYPYLKRHNRDFFGEVTRELHQQGISCLGYIIISWNLKYAKEHPEVSFGWFPIICLNSPYTDLICEYSREVLTHYPIVGLRYDVLDQPTQCRCKDCRIFYKELFGDEMPANWRDWQTRERFRIESITRCMQRIYEACKQTKSSVEVWQNWFNDRHACDLRASKYVDLAYLEFADPFRELFLNGVFDKGGIITGKILQNHATRRMCLVLGGRCYSYFPVTVKTMLPDDVVLRRYSAHKNPKSHSWFKTDLAPFYAMVEKIEPYLIDAKPVPAFGVVFSEAARFRYQDYRRETHMKLLRRLSEPYLRRSAPPEFLAAEKLAQCDLSRFKLLVLPESSGLPEEAHEALRRYVRGGGRLLVTGQALLHDEQGNPRDDFALADVLGVSHLGRASSGADARWRWSNHVYGGQRVTLDIDAPGERTVNVWMRESGSRIDRFVLTTNADYMPRGAGPEADLVLGRPVGNTIVFEAEGHQQSIPRNKCSWELRRDLAGFRGEGFQQAMPVRGKKLAENYATTAPEMHYRIHFKSPGRYYAWVRQACDSTSQDSIHIGLDGKGLATYDFNTGSSQPSAAKPPEKASPIDLAVEQQWPARDIYGAVERVRSTDGRSSITTSLPEAGTVIVLHVNEYGSGRAVYLATSDDTSLTCRVIDAMVPRKPVTVWPPSKQAILTRQEPQGRWILHLMSDGDYAVEIHRDSAWPEEVVGQCPAEGWKYHVERAGAGLRVRVSGQADGRLLVLK